MIVVRWRPKQPVDYLLVLDFEATCEKDHPFYPHEIIEFPIVLVNAATLEIEDGTYSRD